MLIDAGADTTSAVRLTAMHVGSTVLFNGTPLALATLSLHEKKVNEEAATKEQLNTLEGIRRFLLQVEAVHAMSWLWHSDVPSIVDTAARRGRVGMTSTSLRMTLPTLRRRATRPGVVLAPLLR